MADSFFGFDTSSSNLNDDEGAGEPSEDEYDALNDETFGQDSEEFDWEVQHEHLASQLESSRRHNSGIDDAANEQLEASLSQLVLDETDAPHVRTLGSNVWRHDISLPTAPTPVLKNVCTVEELERQLRQNQPQPVGNQNFFQPRFQPVILQRPPGLQAPVPLPFAPQQMRDINQPFNKIIGQPNQLNHMGQTNQLMQNHMPPNMNQMGQNVNQLGQNLNQLGQNMNQLGQNVNQLGQNVNQFMQTSAMPFQNNQMGQSNLMNMTQNMHSQPNQLMQNHVQMNQLGQSGQNLGHNMPIGPNTSIGPNLVQNLNQMSQQHQMGQNLNPMGPNNQLGQMSQPGNQLNQLGQNMNQMMPNGNQFGPSMGQFPPMMGQPRMMAPPPGMNMPRQNFGQNMTPFSNFRAPSMPPKPNEQPINQNMMNMNQQMLQQQQIKNQSPQQPIKPNQPTLNQSTLNQSPQSKPVQKLNQTQKVDQKVQKSRVYNNSQQKVTLPSQNLTSESLVQIIQNTHRMLQLNSYHNANHHPMLNNRNNFFNNNQFVNNHFFGNQRQNGSFSNNRHMNGDDASCGSDGDEYAGLMSSREKQWLVNIQMLQLNTGTPYIHDFYYTVFLKRQASKEKEGIKEAHKANQQNHPFYSGAVKQENHNHGRERHNSNRHNSTSEDAPTPRTYVPTQFENSLGKLQCGSVTAPRKIIDVELVASDAPGNSSRAPSRASTTNPNEVPRELKRTKQLLLDIEALYLVLLRLEELNDPLAISTALILKEREEKQKQLEAAQKELENEQEDESNLFLKNIESVQRRPKQDSPKSESVDKRQVVNLAVSQKPPVKNLLDEDKEELMTKMFAGLLHSDRVAQMLTVRKGRTLICRFLNRVPASHVRLRGLWSRVLRALPSVARRQENSLRELAPHYRSYIHNTTGWAPILESCGFLSEALDPARTPYVLTSSLTLSCVCALVERASTLVNTPEPTGSERQWSKFLKTLARALKHTTLRVARPVQPLPAAVLNSHVKQLESRSSVEILQRGTSVDVTRNEVHRQLRDHLC